MIGQGAALPPFLFIALCYSHGRGAIFRRNIEFAVLGSGIGVLQYYVRCKTQSFFARGSSKPLSYDVEMDFQNKTIIFFCKNKRTRYIKAASSLLRFLTRKRTGYGAEPLKRGTGAEPLKRGTGAEPLKRGSGRNPGKKLFCQFAALFKALLYCLYAGGAETVFFQSGNARNGCSAGRANVIF